MYPYAANENMYQQYRNMKTVIMKIMTISMAKCENNGNEESNFSYRKRSQ